MAPSLPVLTLCSLYASFTKRLRYWQQLWSESAKPKAVFTRHISDPTAIGTGPVARVQTRSSRSSRSGFSRPPLDVIGSDRDRSRPLCVRSTLSCERATSRSWTLAMNAAVRMRDWPSSFRADKQTKVGMKLWSRQDTRLLLVTALVNNKTQTHQHIIDNSTSARIRRWPVVIGDHLGMSQT